MRAITHVSAEKTFILVPPLMNRRLVQADKCHRTRRRFDLKVNAAVALARLAYVQRHVDHVVHMTGWLIACADSDGARACAFGIEADPLQG